jgi:hypothetical protein
MICEITSVAQYKKVKGSDSYKHKYHISLDDDKYIALFWNELEEPIVYDVDMDAELSLQNWHLMKIGYVYGDDYMHRCVIKCDGNTQTIDHINEIKVDNRKCNLRIATQSEQNSNRVMRKDKLPPPAELLEHGVLQLPKYIRWDNTEQKFIIDKHPRLVQDLLQKKRNKPFVSGTKSTKLTVIQKYSDILARLQELDENDNDLESRTQFKEIKKKLFDEYQLIKKTILQHNNIEYIPSANKDNNTIVNAVRNTAPGRKTDTAFSEESGIDITDIPKYCYYRKKTDKRGDFFVIDRHPNLETKTWSTTSSNKVSTKAKFEMLMEKYNELSNKSITP